MRIWLINHYFVPPTQAGGTRHYHLAKQLVDRGHEVTIIAANFNHFTHEYLATKDKLTHEIIDGINVIWLPTPAYHGNHFSRLRNIVSFSWQCWQERNYSELDPPDIILGSSPHLFSAWAASRCAKRYHVPFILEIRDLWPETLVQLGNISRWHPLVLLFSLIERHLYQKAHQIITLLPGANDYISQHGAIKSHIHYLPNFIDLQQIPSSAKTYSKEKFTVMYAGSHGHANQLALLIDAAIILEKKHPSLAIEIILIGNGASKPELQRKAKQHNLQNIQFEAPVPKSEICQHLQKADAFIIILANSPLYRWGISLNKLFDYFAMSQPIIFVGDCPFNPVLANNAGLCVNEFTPHALCEAIIKMRNTSVTERLEMGQRGLEYVKQHHNLENIADDLEGLLKNACSGAKLLKVNHKNQHAKRIRLFDFTASVFLSIIFAPIMLFTAILVRLFIGKPILFRQTRPGLHAKPFMIYKFRTMLHSTDKFGNALNENERITRLGKWIRKYSLDELPQLWNVIKGDLSLVGPRPLLMEYLPLYNEEQLKRHNVPPGITGWAQIKGRNKNTWHEKFKLDNWYVEHRSLWLNIKILAMTVIRVIKPQGVNQNEQLSMEKFNGNQ